MASINIFCTSDKQQKNKPKLTRGSCESLALTFYLLNDFFFIMRDHEAFWNSQWKYIWKKSLTDLFWILLIALPFLNVKTFPRQDSAPIPR